MLNELSEAAFVETMQSKMVDVTRTAEPVMDIWPYVAELVNNEIVPAYVLEENLAEKVYRNIDYSYEHVLLPTDNADSFIVIVVDRNILSIYGHYKLEGENGYGNYFP